MQQDGVAIARAERLRGELFARVAAFFGEYCRQDACQLMRPHSSDPMRGGLTANPEEKRALRKKSTIHAAEARKALDLYTPIREEPRSAERLIGLRLSDDGQLVPILRDSVGCLILIFKANLAVWAKGGNISLNCQTWIVKLYHVMNSSAAVVSSKIATRAKRGASHAVTRGNSYSAK